MVVQKALKAAIPRAPKRIRRRRSGSARNSATVDRRSAPYRIDGRSDSAGRTRRSTRAIRTVTPAAST